jgi:hypothetical protein
MKRLHHRMVLDCPDLRDDTAFEKSCDTKKMIRPWKVNAIRKRCRAMLATALQDAGAQPKLLAPIVAMRLFL